MFAPMTCTQCRKSFQIPDAAAGTPVNCPWCQAGVPAQPVAGVAVSSVAPVAASRVHSSSEPLSLDPDPPEASASATPKFKKFPLRTAILVVMLSVLAFSGTFFIRGYQAGRVPASAWIMFTPPDGSCSIEMPGEPTAHALSALPIAVSHGGEEFITTGWYSGVQAWVGWYDLDLSWAVAAAEDREGNQTDPIINAGQKQRIELRKATLRKEGKMLVNAFHARELQLESEHNPAVEWLFVVPKGDHPRLYFVGIAGKNISPDHPSARRLFTSLRVNEK